MTDIVERLIDCTALTNKPGSYGVEQTCEDAIDEIKRLRARVAELEAALTELLACLDLPDPWDREHVPRVKSAFERARASLPTSTPSDAERAQAREGE